MRRPWLVGLLACGVASLLSGERVVAQAYNNPNARYGAYAKPPVISPYLDLLSGGNPAVNYYNRVVPDMQRPAMVNQFNATVQDLERRLAAPPAATTTELLPTLPGTGHAAQFMNYSPYYNFGQLGTSGSTPLNAGARTVR